MKARGGFSLVQIVLVMVILAVIGTSMAPRFTSAASDARTASLCERLQLVRRHIEVYRRQHADSLPISAGETAEDFVRRITNVGEALSGEDSDLDLDRIPVNPYNRLDTVRVGGPEAGAGTHGWRFDPVTGDFRADDRCDTDDLPNHANL
ncbi:MAG: type II secretion system protein [Phycisphaerales bacterium]